MKYHTQYRKEGGGKLVLYRKFWWFTWMSRYLPFDNKRKKVEKEMSELSEKLIKKYDEYLAIEAEEKQINKIIKNTRGEEENRGAVVVQSLPVWPPKHKDAPEPSKLWTRFEAALKGGVANVASTITGIGGAHFTRINGEDMRKGYQPTDDGEEDIVVSEFNHPIRPESNNQQKKQRSQDNNQQNN